jgi:hypothetical protein
MSMAERIQFKQKITDTVISLAKKYRSECLQMKLNMDLNGVFHPEANAHRVHCIYLMKLYKVSTVSKLYLLLTLSACYRSPCLCCVSLSEGALRLPRGAIQSEHCIKALLASHPVCLLPLSLFVLCFFI